MSSNPPQGAEHRQGSPQVLSEPILTVTEAAALIGEEYKRVYNLVRAGKIASYRVSREYRIMRSELVAYFTRQGEQLPPLLREQLQSEPVAVGDAVLAVQANRQEGDSTSAWATGRQSARPDPAGRGAVADGGGPVAGGRGAVSPRTGAKHTRTSARTQPLIPDAWPPEPRIDLGNPAVSSSAAAQLETDYIENFQASFSSGFGLTHPNTGEMIRLPDWQARAQSEDQLHRLARLLNTGFLRETQRRSYPNNRRFQFWIEPFSIRGIGRRSPKQGLIVECSVLARLDRHVHQGYDPDPISGAELDQELKERRVEIEQWSSRRKAPIASLCGLASPTGWSAEAIASIRRLTGDEPLVLFLVDLADNQVYTSQVDDRVAHYLELYERPLGGGRLAKVYAQVTEQLARQNVVTFADLQANCGCSLGILEDVCVVLTAEDPAIRVVDNNGQRVLRRG